jgi:hypothetical protein
MTREEAIERLAEDMTDNMGLDELAEFVAGTMMTDMSDWPEEDLKEEWEFRFPDEDNPFGE